MAILAITDSMKILACATAAHEANRAYCAANYDLTQESWDDAPQWQRDSAIQGVKGVLRGNTPEECHISWLSNKERDGWKYGPVKDAKMKEHPCMVPYDRLSGYQRAKDELFVTVVKIMAKILELEL